MAALLAAIFITFLLQIFARYAPNLAFLVPIESLAVWLNGIEPIGWTVNLISLLWVWLIFIGCAFAISEKEHVVFDVFVQAMPLRLRLILGAVVSVIVVSAMVYAFLPTWDAVFGSRLMELKKIQTLRFPVTGDKIPIKWLFAPFIIMMLALVARYAVSAISLVRQVKYAGSSSEQRTQ
ncbi:TRAP transporter small permease subunit [Litoricolaceae bacterium]|nr:TRAP transporter small permease subunit [Litorivicinaceae bacterium]